MGALVMAAVLAGGVALGASRPLWTFEIDCDVNGLPDAATKAIALYSLKNGARVATNPPTLTSGACKTAITGNSAGYSLWALRSDTISDGSKTSEVSKALAGWSVQVKATGPDAFLIDRSHWWATAVSSGWAAPGLFERVWGANNAMGWCLSTDPTDTFGPTHQDDICAPCWEFKIDESQPSKCPGLLEPSVNLPSLVNFKITKGTSNSFQFVSVPQEGTKVDLWKEDEGSGRQRWQLKKRGDGTYNIEIGGGTTGGHKLLSVPEEGDRVDLYTHDDGSGRQRWRIMKRFWPNMINSVETNPQYNLMIAGGVKGDRRIFSMTQDGQKSELVIENDNSGRQDLTMEIVNTGGIGETL